MVRKYLNCLSETECLLTTCSANLFHIDSTRLIFLVTSNLNAVQQR